MGSAGNSSPSSRAARNVRPLPGSAIHGQTEAFHRHGESRSLSAQAPGTDAGTPTSEGHGPPPSTQTASVSGLHLRKRRPPSALGEDSGPFMREGIAPLGGPGRTQPPCLPASQFATSAPAPALPVAALCWTHCPTKRLLQLKADRTHSLKEQKSVFHKYEQDLTFARISYFENFARSAPPAPTIHIHIHMHKSHLIGRGPASSFEGRRCVYDGAEALGNTCSDLPNPEHGQDLHELGPRVSILLLKSFLSHLCVTNL